MFMPHATADGLQKGWMHLELKRKHKLLVVQLVTAKAAAGLSVTCGARQCPHVRLPPRNKQRYFHPITRRS